MVEAIVSGHEHGDWYGVAEDSFEAAVRTLKLKKLGGDEGMSYKDRHQAGAEWKLDDLPPGEIRRLPLT